jgi:hypothetical protein
VRVFCFFLAVFSYWFSLLFVGRFSTCNGLLAVLSSFMNGLLQIYKYIYIYIYIGVIGGGINPLHVGL